MPIFLCLLCFLFLSRDTFGSDPFAVENVELKENLKKFHAIIKQYEEQLSEDPQNIKLILAIADVYYSLREYGKAIKYYRLALEIDPKNIPTKISLAQSYLNHHDLKESYDLLQQLIQHEPDNLIVNSSLGRIAALQHHDVEAEEFYQKVLKKSPEDLNTLYYLGELRTAQKRYVEAQRILKNLVRREPKSTWIVRSLQKAELGPIVEAVQQLEKKGDYQAAVSLYKKKMDENPYSPDIYLQLALLYLRQDNSLEAIQTLKMGLKLYPDDHGLLLSLGFAYLSHRDISQANTILEKMAKYRDSRADAIAGLGRIAALDGNAEKAEKLYELSTRINPLNTTAFFYLAQLRIDQKRFEEALQILEKITKIDPQQTDATKSLIEEAELAPLIETANQMEKNHHPEEAEKIYKEIIAKFPHKASSYIRLGHFYLIDKQYEKAIQNYLVGLNANPQSPDLQVTLGYAYLSNKEYDRSEQLFKEVLDRSPLNIEALVGIGRLNWLIGNKQQAADIYEKALLTDPNNETALSFLADLRIDNHEFIAAESLFERILKINPHAEWAQQGLLKARYGDQFNEIKALERTENLDEAIIKAQKLVKEAPKSIEAYLILGNLYTLTKQNSKLVGLYQEGLIYNPNANQLRVNLGLAYLNLKQIREAKRSFHSVLKNDPTNTEAITGLGRVAALTQHPDWAEQLYNDALKLNPESLLTLSYLGEFSLKQKKYAQAQEIYEKILKILPDATWAKIALNDAKYGPILDTIGEKEGTKDFHEAEVLYQELIQESDYNTIYYIKLGQLYIKTNRAQEAISLYDQGLKEYPTSIDLEVALGFAYLANGELEKGKRLFKVILKRNPKEANAIAGLGRQAELEGNLINARLRYQQALKIDPNNMTALIYLAELMYKQGDYVQAKKNFRKILSLDSNAQWVKQALKDAKHGKLLQEIKSKVEVNDLKGAEILWEQLLVEEPNDSDYFLRAGLFYHKIKLYQKAINTYYAGLKFTKNPSDLYAALGLAYLSQKKWTDARKAFRRSLKSDPKNPDALAGLADLALINENFSQAEKLVLRALSIDPQRIAALSVLGNLYMKEHRYQEAEKTYEKLHQLRPKEKWILLELDDAKFGHNLDQIKVLIKQENFSEAARRYSFLLEQSPDNPNYYFGLGQMYMRLKEYGLSIQTNLAGLEKNPDANALRIALGYAYFFSDQLDASRQALTKALQVDAKDPEALAGLGRVYDLEKDFCLAESLYKQALHIDPKNLSALSFLGELLMKEKRYSEAQEIFTELWQILPDAKWVQHSWRDARDGPIRDIAQRYADREEFELAAELYSQLIDLVPDSPDRYLALGQMYVNMQRYRTGICIYEQGLSLDPEAWYLWRGIAFAYILMEDYCCAQKIFTFLVEQDPDDAESWAGLGRIKALTGALCSAEQYYFISLGIKPDNLIALSFLADLRQVEGYNFSSLENYEQIAYAAIDIFDETRRLPKWVRKGYNNVLNLTQPTLNILGIYHEENQWNPVKNKWSAEYLVYGGTALVNYPIDDTFTLWGSCTDKFYHLKDLLTHKTLYSFDVQKGRIGAKWMFARCLSLEAIIGFTNFSPYQNGTFKMQHGTIAEPSFILSYNAPTQKAVLSFTTDSDLVARDFNTNKAKIVGYYQINGAYSRKIFTRAWLGLDCNACWYRDYVNNNSQKAMGWFQWRPPIYSDNISFRYFMKYQTFSKNIPDYYTYKPQVINQLQVTLEKPWRVCWADSLYTSLTYGHGWQNTRTRFRQIIVVTSNTTTPPMGWDNRQYNIVLGNIIYKCGQLQWTIAGDYYRDTQKYTMWTISGDLTWRF